MFAQRLARSSIRYTTPRQFKHMKVAVQGCCHGELDLIYKDIQSLERKGGYNVDLVLICGDYKAIRTQADLNCLAVQPWHRHLGDYHKYYTGEKTAPKMTIVIGGNHEASNHFWELYHGGWLAPNIYYLGTAGAVKFNGLRIAGASGIYKPDSYKRGHDEAMPYNKGMIRTIYHHRQYEMTKLSHLSSPDVFMSHDWPATIDQHGDTEALLRQKPTFAPDISAKSLGSPPLMEVLKNVRPSRWFAAHMHVKFEAEVVHSEEGVCGNVPGTADATATSTTATNVAKQAGAPSTKFVALDKCRKQDYIEVYDIPAPETQDPPKLTFDTEWLGITRAFHSYLPLTREPASLPPAEEMRKAVNDSIAWVEKNALNDDGSEKEIESVQQFVMTSPGPIPGFEGKKYPAPVCYTNPQTVAFCNLLGIENKINPGPTPTPSSAAQPSAS